MTLKVYPLSYFSFQPVLHDWCNKGRPVSGMVHIKEPLLLIGKSGQCGDSGFPLTICVVLYRRYITVFSASLNKKKFLSFLLKVSLCKESAMSQNLNGITHQVNQSYRRKEGNVLFNDALITFYLRLYGIRHMVKDHSDSERGNLLPPHMLPLQAARVILYAPSHRQDNTYHSLYYTSRRALAGTRNSSMGPP